MAETTELTREVASALKDYEHPTFLGLMRSVDPVLLAHGGPTALRVYRDLERDAHVHAVMQKRRFAVVGRPWEVLPASQRLRDRKAADLVKAQLEAMDFDGLCLGLLQGLLLGYAVAEVMWEVRDGALWAVAGLQRRSERFVFKARDEGGWETRLRTLQEPLEGEALPERKFIVHSCGAWDGNPYGIGLGHQLYWPVEFKRQGLTFWLVFADKYGSPTVVGEYEQGRATPAERSQLLTNLKHISQEAAITVPKGTVVRLLEATRSGSVETYEQLVRIMDEQVSEAVLGETGSTNQHGSGGSRARDQVGNAVRLEVAKADADLLSATLQRTLLRWIVELNCPGAGVPTVWRNFEEPIDLKGRAERDQLLFQMGFRPTLAEVQATYGGEWVDIKASLGTAGGAIPNPTGLPEGGVELGEGGPGEGDPVDALADQAEAAGAKAMAALLEPVKRLVRDASSLDEIRDGLLECYPDMDTPAFAELLTQAFLAANLAGRDQVRRGR
jgi:phage gp29-like protein